MREGKAFRHRDMIPVWKGLAAIVMAMMPQSAFPGGVARALHRRQAPLFGSRGQLAWACRQAEMRGISGPEKRPVST